MWLQFYCPFISVSAAADEPVQRQDGQRRRASPVFFMRAETGPSAAQRSALAESSGFLDVRVQDCQAELLASTVTNIGPFMEDEFSADGQPMRLHLHNVTIIMKVGHDCPCCVL